MGLALGLAVLGLSQAGAAMKIGEQTLARKAVSFEWLETGDRVIIDVISQGCFSRNSFVLEFTKREILRVRNLKPDKGREADSKRWMPLSQEDSKRLDNLVNYYLAPPNGGWTNQEDIKITFYRSEKVIRMERFVTWKCPIDRPNLLSVYEILERMHGFLEQESYDD